MNTVITSREAILEGCRKLFKSEGPSRLSIRKVAGLLDISTGSIYHYFPSKSTLLQAAVESVWQEIFTGSQPCGFSTVEACVSWIFDCLKRGEKAYPGFLGLHSSLLENESQNTGSQERMSQSWQKLKALLVQSLANELAGRDSRQPESAPDPIDCSSVETFADAVFSLILASAYLHTMDEKDVLAYIHCQLQDH